MIESVLYLTGTATALIALFFSIRKLLGFLFPIHVEAGISIRLIEPMSDEIQATVTNRSREPVYVVKCRGRSANRISYIISTHLRNPRVKPSLYKNIKFGAPVFEMIDSDPIRLEPFQQVKLTHSLSFSLPISGFTNPMLQIEVILSNGRVFRSRRMTTPTHWSALYRINKNSQGESHV